jgi:hypothetical protein
MEGVVDEVSEAVTLISSFMNYTDFCGMYGDSFLLAKGKML